MDKLSLEEQIRECFGRVVYTHKCHEKKWQIKILRDSIDLKLPRYGPLL